MKEHSHTFTVADKEITVTTGKYASLSPGAVTLQMGGTVLFATAAIDAKDAELDYFPLSVEYIEKMYARGAISGSKFKKREGMPSDEATIKAREVDHSIRSLFPKSFKKPLAVILTVLAYDGINDPQALTVLGASLAVMQSGVPFAGPCSSVIICVDKEGALHINPPATDREEFAGEFIISGVDGKVLSFEGWGKELSEETMGKIIDRADEVITQINKEQTAFINQIDKSLQIDASEYANIPAPQEVVNFVKDNAENQIKEALFNTKSERTELMSAVTKQIHEMNKSQEIPFSGQDISNAVEYVARKHLRKAVLKESKRVSGRALDEIRPLSGDVDCLPTVHGSALFNRGLTQSLSIVTLGPKSSELLIDDMEGEDSKTFMHHYNFPPFSVGEAGRYKYYPGRREIGHGAIGENALKHMIPSTDAFPYTIRVVSEIMSSNGSTSMAATCASSMALMAAGVPIKEQVAGIGVGLVTEDENPDNYKLLLDIEGIEDFYGDMDFKVCGTKNGVTAIQYENKLQGVPLAIIKEAFVLAKTGRMQVLETMNAVIDSPRTELAPNAPKVVKLKIDQDQIGGLIGPGGKNIKELIQKASKLAPAEPDIAIDDDGTVNITAYNQAQLEFLQNTINSMFEKPEIGKIYEGVVDKVMNFGAFINVSSSITGLCHVSEMSDKFVKDANDLLKKGDKVKVKVLKVENGRISFTMKGIGA